MFFHKKMTSQYLIGLDWFEVMCTSTMFTVGDPPSVIKLDNGNIRMSIRRSGIQHWEAMYDISVNNRPFGHICCVPRERNILQPNMILFQALNNVQYETGFLQEFQYLCDKAEWKLRNGTRIDIALDGHGFIPLFQKIMKGKLHKVGQATMTAHFDMNVKCTGYDIGKRSSAKWLTCYNKKVEMKMKDKPYIKAYWDKGGLDQEKDVERLELKLRRRSLETIFELRYEELDSPEYLASIMRTQFEGWFEFTDPKSNNNVSRQRQIEVIDWDKIDGIYLAKAETINGKEIKRFKQAAKTCFLVWLATDQGIWKSIALNLAHSVDHLEWYKKERVRWHKEFLYHSGENRSGEIHYRFLNQFKQYGEYKVLELFRDQPEDMIESMWASKA